MAQSRKTRRRQRRRLPKFRDVFFGIIATLILYHEVAIRPDDIRPVAAFLVLWFYGMIPVSMADDARKAAASWLVARTPEGAPENGNGNGGNGSPGK